MMYAVVPASGTKRRVRSRIVDQMCAEFGSSNILVAHVFMTGIHLPPVSYMPPPPLSVASGCLYLRRDGR